MAQLRISRAIAASITSLGLVVGLAGLAAADNSTGTISGNGANSSNTVRTKNIHRLHVDNDNDVHLTNNNPQYASSGDANSQYNTGGGANATSGAANNFSTMHASVSLNNSSAMGGGGGGGSNTTNGTISGNGAFSTSTVNTKNVSSVNVDNDNDVRVTNNNCQTATTGDATSSYNVGGSSNATSGPATNTSNSDFSVSITN